MRKEDIADYIARRFPQRVACLLIPFNESKVDGDSEFRLIGRADVNGVILKTADGQPILTLPKKPS
jgi:hypothetical protein